MGVRTLSLALALRALFLHDDAYDRLRDDDNPFIEGLFLVVLLSVAVALLSLVGQIIGAATVPPVSDVQQVVLQTLQGMAWWPSVGGNPAALAEFNRYWDLGWRFLPPILGYPGLVYGAFNVLAWPVLGLVGWLLYGALSYLFARWLGGKGTLNETLGVAALGVLPLAFRGLQFIPFLAVGAAIATWQLLCRYKALRSVHGLSWQRTALATVLPFAVYLVLWIIGIAIGLALLRAGLGR